MSEYISIEPEISEDGRTIIFQTNLSLTEPGEREVYASAAAMDEGSPVAQCLSVVGGMERLTLADDVLVVELEPDAVAHVIIADVAAALRDFFL